MLTVKCCLFLFNMHYWALFYRWGNWDLETVRPSSRTSVSTWGLHRASQWQLNGYCPSSVPSVKPNPWRTLPWLGASWRALGLLWSGVLLYNHGRDVGLRATPVGESVPFWPPALPPQSFVVTYFQPLSAQLVASQGIFWTPVTYEIYIGLYPLVPGSF